VGVPGSVLFESIPFYNVYSDMRSFSKVITAIQKHPASNQSHAQENSAIEHSIKCTRLNPKSSIPLLQCNN
jgi:hypothetical protein